MYYFKFSHIFVVCNVKKIHSKMTKIFAILSLLTFSFIFSQNSEELNKKGIEFLMQKNYEQGIPLLQKSAELGNAEAQYNLGYCYEFGVGVSKDEKIAIFWYQKSADQNYNDGLYAMMMAYSEGKGVEPNYDKAFEYAMKCSKNNDATCMFNVVTAYKEGIGTSIDKQKMLEWAIKLGKLKNPENLTLSGRITSARLNLAYMFRDGIDVEKDIFKSYIWFLIYNESKRDFSVFQQNDVVKEIQDIENRLTKKQKFEAIIEAEKILERKLINLKNLYKSDI